MSPAQTGQLVAAHPFDSVVGHRRTLAMLSSEPASPAHAYLFVGPEGVGKGTVARAFAALLVCPTGGAHDGECSSCRRAASGNHPDVNIVEPEGRTMLTVSQARTTMAQATLAPVESARKVFVFDEAGVMSEGAANALLKTLEEPNATTAFVLVSDSEEDLPATLGSRCRIIHFGRVDEAEVIAALEKVGVANEQATEAARLGGGRPGLALGLATQPEVASFRRAWLAVPGRVAAAPGDSFILAEELLDGLEPLLAGMEEHSLTEHASKEKRERDNHRAKRELLISGVEILASWYLDAAAVQFGATPRNRDLELTDLTEVPPAVAVASAERVLDAAVELRANQRPTLVLASLFTELGQRSSSLGSS
jgi:DNA polymerase-3 subunit delta'